MALIASLVSISGTAFVIRTLHVFHKRGLLADSLLVQIGSLSLMTTFLCPILAQTHPTHVLVGILLLNLILFFALSKIERNALGQLTSRLSLFLDMWILNAKMGNSLNAARELALVRESKVFQSLIRPVFDVSTRQTGCEHAFLPNFVVDELREIGNSKHSGLSRLEALRKLLRQDAEFRRKSGQAVRQTHIQAVIMLVLLIALATFSVNRYGWGRSADFIVYSSGLSLIGLAVMQRVARKTQWKF